MGAGGFVRRAPPHTPPGATPPPAPVSISIHIAAQAHNEHRELSWMLLQLLIEHFFGRKGGRTTTERYDRWSAASRRWPGSAVAGLSTATAAHAPEATPIQPAAAGSLELPFKTRNGAKRVFRSRRLPGALRGHGRRAFVTLSQNMPVLRGAPN